MSAQPYTDTYDDGTRRLEVTWADTISPRKAEWAWEHEGHGRIPVGSLSLVTGGEGVGKSSFGIWLAAQITRGARPGAYWDTPAASYTSRSRTRGSAPWSPVSWPPALTCPRSGASRW